MRILVVEDETKLASILEKALAEAGFDTAKAHTGTDGLAMALSQPFDLVLLDLKLPFMSGLEVCTRIREHKPDLPVLMLTAYAQTEDVVAGLDAGADDYLAKPFRMEELNARIRALLRRQSNPKASFSNGAQFHLANLVIDSEAHEVRRGEVKIPLTAREFELLAYLAKNKGRVRTRQDIARDVWGLDFHTGTNFVDVYISYLRSKIDKPFHPKLIHTVVGVGYVLKEE
jgi:DNA-binding response OmpR family regulator